MLCPLFPANPLTSALLCLLFQVEDNIDKESNGNAFLRYIQVIYVGAVKAYAIITQLAMSCDLTTVGPWIVSVHCFDYKLTCRFISTQTNDITVHVADVRIDIKANYTMSPIKNVTRNRLVVVVFSPPKGYGGRH